MSVKVSELESAELAIIDDDVALFCSVEYDENGEFDSFYIGGDCPIDTSNIDMVQRITGATYSIDGMLFTLYKTII